MANKSLSRNERVYLQDHAANAETTVPNTSGTATVAVANYACHVGFKADLQKATIMPKCKTGTRSARVGIAGRSLVNWSADFELEGSGVANIAPEIGPILRSVFGNAATVITGGGSVTGATNASPIVITQVGHGKADGAVVRISGVTGNTAANGVWVINQLTVDTYELIGSTGNAAYVSGGTSTFAGIQYTLTDDILAFCAWLFRQPSTLQQRLAYGLVTNSMTVELGQDIAMAKFSGEGIHLLDSDTFSSETASLKAALTAFPVEPTGTLPTDAGIVAGFTGRFVCNGSTFTNIRSATLAVGTGNELVKENFGEFNATESEGDERAVSLSSVTLNDNDDAAMKALYAAFKNKTLLDTYLQVGTVALNTWVFSLKGVQLNSTELDDSGRRFLRRYTNCRATGSTPGALDELRLNII